jgi:hypothetical protein
MTATATTATITAAAMTANILATWEQATAAIREQGAQWYGEAREAAATMAAQSGKSIDVAAAVIAHLSPRTTWARNVAGATSLLLTGEAPGCIGANVERARKAIDAADPIATINGPKTRAFAANILGDTDAVTVDVWALRVALASKTVDEKILARKGGYELVAGAYRAAAAEAGVSPATMQAATWVVARNGRVG